MKKILMSMVMMSLVAGFTACSDNSEEHCLVGKTVDGCVDGSYVTCVLDDDSDGVKGHLVYEETHKIGGLPYRCNKDDVLEAILHCGNSVFQENGEQFIYTDRTILKCEGSTINDVTNNYMSICIKGERVYYDSGVGSFVPDSCAAEGKICEEYQKDNTITAVCIEKTKVENACGDASTYGRCEGNTLVICSDLNQSKGKLLRIDCGTISNNHKCMLVGEGKYGHDCALTCGEMAGETVTDFGSCKSNNHLVYCQQNGTLSEVDCNKNNRTCGFTGTYYNCL